MADVNTEHMNGVCASLVPAFALSFGSVSILFFNFFSPLFTYFVHQSFGYYPSFNRIFNLTFLCLLLIFISI